MSISYSPHLEIQISGKAVYLTIHKWKTIIKHTNNLDINSNQARKYWKITKGAFFRDTDQN